MDVLDESVMVALFAAKAVYAVDVHRERFVGAYRKGRVPEVRGTMEGRVWHARDGMSGRATACGRFGRTGEGTDTTKAA